MGERLSVVKKGRIDIGVMIARADSRGENGLALIWGHLQSRSL